MTIATLREAPHLSASSVDTYITCGHLYKLSRVLKLPQEFKPDSMELGTCIHKVLAEYNLSRQAGEPISLDDMKALFIEYWALAVKDDDSVRYSKGKDYEILLNDGLALLEKFYENSADNGFRVIGVEVPFLFQVPEISVPIIGVIDLIERDADGTIIVTDYKTTQKNYTADQIDLNFQLTIYQMAAKLNGLTDGEILLKLDVLIKTKTPKFEQYFTTRSEEDEQRVIGKIREAWNGICSGVFIPNYGTWKCKCCMYKNACLDGLGR